MVLGLALVLGAAGLVATLFLISRRASPSAVPLPSSGHAFAGKEQEDPPDPARSGAGPAPEGAVAAEEGQERTGIAAPGIGIRVVSPSGGPIEGALVTLNRENEDQPFLFRTTGPLGIATVPREALAAPGDRLALWITRPGFFAHGAVLLRSDLGRQSLDVVLEPAPTWSVRVVDGQGDPLGSAEVTHRAAHVESGPDGELLRAFRRSATSVEDGTVPLAPLRDEQELVAAWNGLSSAPWTKHGAQDVDLVILRDLRVGGTVTFEDPEEREPLHVLAFGESAVGREMLVRVEAEEDGAWGPIDLPATGHERFVLRLEGDQTVAQEQVLDSFHPGEEIVVDFQACFGEMLWAIVVDPEDAILHEAEVEVRWLDERQRILSRTFHPDERGYVRTYGFPPGLVFLTGRCEGYAPGITDPLRIPRPENLGIAIEVRPGTSLVGQCFHDGEPVPDFTVFQWPTRLSCMEASRVEMRGSEDGSFVLEEVEVGEHMICISAPGLAPTEPLRVQVVPEGEPLRFDLESAVTARGRIVDAATGEGLTQATVQPLLLSWDGQPFGEAGTRLAVGADGSFELAAFGRGNSACRIEAPGYAPTVAFASTASGAHLDFGLVRLWQAQPLEIVLAARDTIDFSGQVLDLRGPFRIRRRFPPEGVLRVDGLGPGTIDVLVSGPDDEEVRLQHVLVAGGDWRIEIPLDLPPMLLVEVLPASGSELPDCSVFLSYYDDDKRSCSRRAVPQEGVARIPHVTGDMVSLTVVEEDGRILATRSVTMTGDEEQVETVQLGGHAATLRIIGRNGSPLPGVFAYLTSADDQRDFFGRTTDVRGECVVAGVPDAQVLVHLDHPVHGSRPGQLVSLGTGPERVIELVLAGEASLEVQLRTADGVAAGAATMLLDPTGRLVETATLSSAEGLLHWESLEPGGYRVRVVDPGYWGGDVDVSTEDTHRPVVVRALRRTSLELVVRDAEGVPVPGAALQLACLDLGEDVATWLAGGRIDASSPMLRADATGRLRLDHIPEGRYAWTLRDATGEAATGTCVALSGGGSVETIVLR